MIVICGPTASGKTAFAHNLAKNNQGVIVCADSRQLYKGLEIVTASPESPLKQEIPYLLYNFLDIYEIYSAAKYATIAANAIKEIISMNKLPILVGGSGMYLNSLLYGYSDIPQISPEVQSHAAKLYYELGKEDFFYKLISLDPLSKSKITPSDQQRMLRAYCVFKETGKSIIYWHENSPLIKPLAFYPNNIDIIMLNPSRELLYNNCNARLDTMFVSGAIQEVMKTTQDMQFAQINNLPIANTLGIAEILLYLQNQLSLEEALNKSKIRTRQYAKRQITWFKHQLKNQQIISYSTMHCLEKINNYSYNQ